MKAAKGAVPYKRRADMSHSRSEATFEPAQASSPTAHLLTELQLFGYRPFADEPDPRPLPEPRLAAGAIADIFDALVATLSQTRLEPDLDNLLWSTVNLFHRAIDRIERDLDTNEQAQKRGQEEQDGSEIRSVQLERLTREGQGAIERRNAMEFFRDEAAVQYERHTGSLWRPRTGSKVNHRALTSAVIDSRDYLSAKRRAENEVTLPPGPRIALTGGADYNDHATRGADPAWHKEPDFLLPLRPPFGAIELNVDRKAIYAPFTLGGLSTDADAAVLDATERAIPGLFAAGRTTAGIAAGGYVSGISLGDGSFFGRRAGIGAAG